MGWLLSILTFLSNLLGGLRDAQKAQSDKNQREIGEKIQTAADLTAADQAEKNMGNSLAESPKTKAELDAQIKSGEF